jgi:DNA-binding MarR family transcriptional regulator
MKKHEDKMPLSPPLRKELSENPVKLCHDISRLSHAKIREANIDGIMSQHGARLVLASLAANDGATQRAIVDITHLRPPTVSVLLRRMESEGMVELRENPKDRRELCAYLTDYGREIDSKAIEKIKESDAIALEGLSESERETLMALLSKIRENLIVSLSQKECRRDREEEK